LLSFSRLHFIIIEIYCNVLPKYELTERAWYGCTNTDIDLLAHFFCIILKALGLIFPVLLGSRALKVARYSKLPSFSGSVAKSALIFKTCVV
jgi:hypothetical protein